MCISIGYNIGMAFRGNKEAESVIFKDHLFQEWMSDSGILVRTPEEDIPKVKATPKGISGQMYSILDSNRGYLVSNYDLGSDLYHSHKPEAQTSVTALASMVKQKNVFREQLFLAPGLAYALGVEDFQLGSADMILLYSLFKNVNQPVDEAALAETIYGHSERSAIRSLLLSARKFRTFTGFNEEYFMERVLPGDGTAYYKLNEREGLELVSKEANRRKGNVFEPSFQDLLVEMKYIIPMSLMSHNLPNYLRVNFPIKKKVYDLLSEKPTKIIPLDIFHQKVYGDNIPLTHTSSLNNIMREINQDVDLQGMIKRFPDLGYAMGIRSIRLSPNEWRLFHRLWINSNYTVSYEDLSKDLVGESTDEAIRSLSRIVSPLRQKLKKNNLLIGLAENLSDGTRGYNLEKKVDIVDLNKLFN